MVLFVLRWPLILAIILIQAICCGWFLWAAYAIRLYPIKQYGYIIHEFDPWFNYRAAEYLAEHGTSKFFKWYDYMSWYPLGRPVGTTIYPGMQLAAVGISKVQHMVPPFDYEVPFPAFLKRTAKRLRAWMKKKKLIHFPPLPVKLTFTPMSVNDICVTMPAWFGSLQALFGGLLTYESTHSVNAAVIAMGVMAIIPANLMRSVAGEFDNEAVAVTAILSTFWLWTRSVRTPSSWPIGIFAGLSYIYMVAAWGGYIMVLNCIGVHALLLVALGRFNSGVYRAYTLFYVVGTAGAIQIPVVGWTPLRSLEQIGPLGVFLGYQILAFCDARRRRTEMTTRQFVLFRILMFSVLVIALFAVASVLMPMGYFGPLSSRIRGLFVKHTKTGNPLVDSVAEHQPANASMYASHLNLPLDYVKLASIVLLLHRTNGSYFLAVYGFVAMHFSLKMSRLVLICGPITAIMCAVWAGFCLDVLVEPFLLLLGKTYSEDTGPLGKLCGSEAVSSPPASGNQPGTKGKKGKAEVQKQQSGTSRVNSEQEWGLEAWDEDYRPGGIAQMKRKTKMALVNALPQDVWEGVVKTRRLWKQNKMMHFARVALSIALGGSVIVFTDTGGKIVTFMEYCDMNAQHISNPRVMKLERYTNGQTVMNDDPLKGYQFMATKTPEDSRIFAWWDYGYQITGIGNRTSLADGNTWNHEQIATIGRLLSGRIKQSHSVIRHLADYVLIMTGGVNDDLGISRHFARIGNSVFPDHCGDDDPSCNKYDFYGGDRMQPTPMMERSLVYQLYMHGKGTNVDPKLFEMVYKSPRDLLRVFKVVNVSQESKAWVADPANRVCDAPGSWYCVGQYPPAIKKFLDKRRNFAQVEDFNKKGEKSAYTKMIEKQHGKGEL